MIRTMTEYIEDYVNELKLLLEALDKESILKATGIIETAHANDGTIYIIGNGGSAATASHMANDFSKGIGKRAGKHFKALSLTDNIPLLTAISNDEGYERVFVDQLKVFLNKDDLVIGISASGNSGNIVNALQYAREKGARTIGLVGFDGGKIKVTEEDFPKIEKRMKEIVRADMPMIRQEISVSEAKKLFKGNPFSV